MCEEMYDFKIIKFGKGVTLTGFPEVHYGMGLDDLQNLKQVIDDFLQNQSNDPQYEGVKAPSERSRSPSNQSSTIDDEK